MKTVLHVETVENPWGEKFINKAELKKDIEFNKEALNWLFKPVAVYEFQIEKGKAND